MDRHLIQRVAQVLRDSFEVDIGNPYFGDGEPYSSVAFDKNNFKSIEEGVMEKSRIFAVDGGNLEIISTPSVSVSLIRVAAVGFHAKNRIKLNFPDRVEAFCVVRISAKNGHKYAVLDYFPVQESYADYIPANSTFDFNTFGEGNIYAELNIRPLSIFSSMARKYAEWFYLYKILEHVGEGDFVIRDGVYQPADNQEEDFVKKILAKAKEHKIVLTGLAKTTTLVTDTGLPVTSALQRLADKWGVKAPWYYYPLALNKDDETHGDIYIVKFTDIADYAFRFEIMRKTMYTSIETIFSFLKYAAHDCIFPGYPYMLLQVDKLARVERAESKPLYLRLISEMKEKKDMERAIKSLDAHDWISRY
jgi:hypothetical protein